MVLDYEARTRLHTEVSCVGHSDTQTRVGHAMWCVVDQIRSQRLRTQLGHGQETTGDISWVFFFFVFFL